MKALVTGSAGFLGRHFVEELLAQGYEVVYCDIAYSDAARGPGVRGDALFLFQHETEVFDLVVHCAAVEPHRVAIDTRPWTFPMNMHLDAALFDWAIRTKQRQVLYISSSAVYPIELQQLATIRGRLAEGEVDLDYPQQPDGSYGVTKLTSEHMAAAARASGVPVTVVRPFSGYGADQGEDWPFGAFLHRALRRESPFLIWGSADQVRDWIHVSDVVRGSLRVAHHQRESDFYESVNVCTGQGTAMGDLALLFMQAVGYEATLNINTSAPMGVMNRVGDPVVFFEYYEPKITIQQGVFDAVRQLTGG